MSIAEKLTTVAENVPKVYKAGQDSMVDPDKIIPKSTSGNPVYLDDVSEIPHDVGITLTSDSITNFSDVNVTVRGKNLYPYETCAEGDTVNYNGIDVTYEGDGIYHVCGECSNTTKAELVYNMLSRYCSVLVNADDYYTLSTTLLEGSTTHRIVPYLSTTDKLGSGINWINTTIKPDTSVGETLTITAKANSTNDACKIGQSRIRIAIGVGETMSVDCRFRVWLERGSTSTPYEPSKYTTYTANADGTVEGVKSLSPYMNIYSDSDVNLLVDYHKSYGIDTENKRFWDGVTQANKRYAYGSAFQYWGFEYLRPPYKIKPTNISYAFLNMPNLKAVEKYFFDFSACNTPDYFTGAIRNNAALEVIEDCNFPEVNHGGVFMNNYLLTTIERIPVNETMTFSASNWGGCPKLSEIRFDGVIGTSISFPVSPLSVDSMKNIIGCLKNYSGTDNAGVYSLTLMDSRWTALEADSTAPNGGTWRDYVIGLGWLT